MAIKILRGQSGEQNEYGIERLAMQHEECDRDEHRISSHRARKPFVHDRNLMVSRATLNCFPRLYGQEAVIMKRFTVKSLAACFVFARHDGCDGCGDGQSAARKSAGSNRRKV